MSLRATLFNTPRVAVSRPRLLVGAAGLLCLAALVLAHALVLTAFLVSSSEGPKRAMAIALLWLVSAAALFFVSRGLRHVILAWRAP
jgi:hypothetical protein